MAVVKGILAENQVGIKVGLLETWQKATMPPEGLCSREEGRLQAEHLQRKEKLNVSNAFRAVSIKNYLSEWSCITSDRFIIETVKWKLKIDFISKPVNKQTPQMAPSVEESKIF